MRQVPTNVEQLRRQRRARRLLRAAMISVLAAMITAPVAPPFALAQPKPARSKADLQAEARKRGEEGLSLFGQKKFAEAYEAFRQADELYHANTLVLFMAHCRRDMGKLLEARDIYKRVVTEAVPKGAAEQFKKAQETARQELDRLSIRVPTIKVVITGSAASKAVLTLDGTAADVLALLRGREVDPGPHTIRAEASGAVPVEKSVSVNEGGETVIDIDLAPMKVVEAEKKKGSIIPGAVAAGVGVAGVGVGAVAGILAKVKVDEIKSRCRPDGQCLQSDQANADAAQTLKTVSTIGFVAGGAVLATGVVLLVLRPGGAKATEPSSSAHVRIGLGSIEVGGSF